MTERIKKTEREHIGNIGRYDIIDIIKDKSLDEYVKDNEYFNSRIITLKSGYTTLFDVTINDYDYDFYISCNSWDDDFYLRVYVLFNLVEKDEAFEKRKVSIIDNARKAEEVKKRKLEKEREKELAELKRLKEKYENGGIV